MAGGEPINSRKTKKTDKIKPLLLAGLLQH
jgi:hypothetical protein